MIIKRNDNNTYSLETDKDTYHFSSFYSLRKKLILEYNLTETEIKAVVKDERPTLDIIEGQIANLLNFALDEKKRLTDEVHKCDKLLKICSDLKTENDICNNLSLDLDEKQNTLLKVVNNEPTDIQPKLLLDKELDILDDKEEEEEIEEIEDKPNVEISIENVKDEEKSKKAVEGKEVDIPTKNWVNLGLSERKCKLTPMIDGQCKILTRVTYNNVWDKASDKWITIPIGTQVGVASYLHLEGVECKYTDDKGYWAKDDNRIIIFKISGVFLPFFNEYSDYFKKEPYYCKYHCKFSDRFSPSEVVEYYNENWDKDDVRLVKAQLKKVKFLKIS